MDIVLFGLTFVQDPVGWCRPARRFCPDSWGTSEICEYTLPNVNSIHANHAIHPSNAPLEQKLFHRESVGMVLTHSVKMALFIPQGHVRIMVPVGRLAIDRG
jgi:hypothetical protein